MLRHCRVGAALIDYLIFDDRLVSSVDCHDKCALSSGRDESGSHKGCSYSVGYHNN